MKKYNPKHLILQYIPAEEKEKKSEVNLMCFGFFRGLLTVVDVREVVEIGRK